MEWLGEYLKFGTLKEFQLRTDLQEEQSFDFDTILTGKCSVTFPQPRFYNQITRRYSQKVRLKFDNRCRVELDVVLGIESFTEEGQQVIILKPYNMKLSTSVKDFNFYYSNDHCQDNIVTLNFSIEVVSCEMMSWNIWRSFMQKGFASDLCLVVDNRKIPVERAVLSTFSPVFKAMFNGNFMESNQSEVEIKEVEYDTMKTFIAALYGYDDFTDIDTAYEVMQLADRFDVPRVFHYCYAPFERYHSIIETGIKSGLRKEAIEIARAKSKGEDYKSLPGYEELRRRHHGASIDVFKSLFPDTISDMFHL